MKTYKQYVIVRKGSSEYLGVAKNEKEALEMTKQFYGTVEIWETVVLSKKEVIPTIN